MKKKTKPRLQMLEGQTKQGEKNLKLPTMSETEINIVHFLHGNI